MHDTHGQGAIKFWLYATVGAGIPLALAWRNAQHHIEEEDHEERHPFIPYDFNARRIRVRDLSPASSSRCRLPEVWSWRSHYTRSLFALRLAVPVGRWQSLSVPQLVPNALPTGYETPDGPPPFMWSPLFFWRFSAPASGGHHWALSDPLLIYNYWRLDAMFL